jgi:hypothetical protein
MIRPLLAAAALAVAAPAARAGPRALAAAPGAAGSIRDAVAGVQLRLDPRAWPGGEVDRALAPVRVTITNHGRRSLLVRYGQFALRSAWGDRLAPLAPYEIAGEPEPVRLERGGNDRFEYAPWSPRAYGAIVPRSSDPVYFEQRQEDPPAIPPDEEVVRRALPEGILQPGGTVTGFLYFPDQRRGTPLTFVADVVDAQTGNVEGTVAIPLTVE